MFRRTSRHRWCARVGAVAIAAALVAGTASSVSATARAQKSKIDKAAVLKLGVGLDAPTTKPSFDPASPQGAGALLYLPYVYDSLLHQMPDGSYTPGLAESAELVDPSTITVKLRPNLKFQDGSALDAEAVKFSILRNKQAKNAALRQAQLQAVSTIDVTSPTTLTIRFSQPIAGSFYNLLSQAETMPVSPTAVNAGTNLNNNPVGAGPFKMVSQSTQLVRMERWPGHYDADHVNFAGVDLVNVASPEARINAYRSGTIDFDGFLTLADLNQLSGAPIRSKVTNGPNDGYDWVMLQCNKNPDLADARVRQALIYATDREALNKVVYQGKGEVQTQLFGSKSPNYDPALAKLYPYNPKKAKQLLAQAGKADLKVTMVNLSLSASAEQIKSMLQQQWAKAGITLNLVAPTNLVQDFFLTGNIQSFQASGAASSFWGSDRITRFFTSSSIGGVCNPTDPAFTADLTTLLGLDENSPKAAKLYQKLTGQILEEARFLPLIVTPTAVAWNNRLAKVKFQRSPIGTLFPDWSGSYVSSK